MPAGVKYRRVLLKISGEALVDEEGGIISSTVLDRVAADVRHVAKDLGIQVGLVMGGGNIWRGKAAADRGMEEAQAGWLWVAAFGFLASLLASASGWRSALGLCGGCLSRTDAAARYGIGSLVYTGEDGRDQVTIAAEGSNLLLSAGAGDTLSAPSGCTRRSASSVSCPPGPSTVVNVDLRGGDDALTVTLPDAPFVHAFVARGEARLDGAAMHTGDAARLTDAGAVDLTATSDAEVVVWEMSATID